MSAIFETEFRDLVDADGNVTKASTAKFVAISLADHANDDGEGAYPGIDKTAKKTNLSRNCVINTLDALKHNGIITLQGSSRFGTNNYTINPECFVKVEGGKSRVLVHPVDCLGTPSVLEGVHPVDPNHTLNKQETSNVLTARDFQEAGEKVEKIIAIQGVAGAWQGRELVPPHLLKYADWWNGKSGQVMKGKVNKEWFKAFNEWYSNGLEISTLDEVYQLEVAWKKVIAKPSELTTKAIAIQALPKPTQQRQEGVSSGYFA
jgi:hypothetical protein